MWFTGANVGSRFELQGTTPHLMSAPACSLNCVHEIGLSCGITPLKLANSAHSGLVAVYGTVEDRACVLIASIVSPASQVLVKLPRHFGTGKPTNVEWSPSGVEEMLLVACCDGNITVLSMSSPTRYKHIISAPLFLYCHGCPQPFSWISNNRVHECVACFRATPDSVNWRFFDSWHAHDVHTPSEPCTQLVSAQWIFPPPSLRWPTVLYQHKFASAKFDAGEGQSGGPFQFANQSDCEQPGEDLRLPNAPAGSSNSNITEVPAQEWVRCGFKHCFSSGCLTMCTSV